MPTRLSRLCLGGFLTLLFLLQVSVVAGVSVPAVFPEAPPGLPTGMPGEDRPWAARASEHAPQIAAATYSASANDTLIITGIKLRGASLRAWSGGQTYQVQTLRQDDQKMVAVMPGIADRAVTLVWPEADGHAGEPIRVNAPALWWAWVEPDGHSGGTLRLFGRNLILHQDATPTLALAEPGGEARLLTCEAASPFSVTARLPADLGPGTYHAWVHNASGGAAGWSRPLTIKIKPTPTIPSRVIRVSNTARPGRATRIMINQAIRQAQSAGGGAVELARGTYLIDAPIIVSPGPPVHLRGAAEAVPDERYGKVYPAAILHTRGSPGLAVVNLSATGSRVSRLTVISDSETPNSVVRLSASGQKVDHCLLMRTREQQPATVVHAAYHGEAHQVIEDCAIYGVSSGIRVGRGCDYVRISRNRLRGGHTHGSGTASNAVVNQGGNHMIFEGCDIAAIDRAGGKVLSRTCLLYHSSIRGCYIANNHSREVGPHGSVPGIEGNTGEQYLLHRAGETVGRVPVSNATHAGIEFSHRLPDQVTTDGDWVVYIDGGRGAGQWRTVTGRTPTGGVAIDPPWRVAPDAESSATLLQAFRHNVIAGNTVDGPANPEPRMKVVGVYLYQSAFENIVAGNTLNRVAVGAAVSADVGLPSAWNLIEANTIGVTGGYTGGTAYRPMAINEHARGLRPAQRSGIDGWLTLGNTFRRNTARGSSAGAVGWLKGSGQNSDGYRVDPDRGLMMTVIEHNTFNAIAQGVTLTAPSNWTVIRGNTFDFDGTGQPVKHHPRAVVGPLIEP